MVSFWNIDLWPKTFLILYPSNENSTTEITFVCIHETQTLLKNFVLLFVLPLPFVFQTFRLVSIFVRRAVIHLQCNLYNLAFTQYPFLSTGQLHSPSYRHKLTIESPKLKENIAESKNFFIHCLVVIYNLKRTKTEHSIYYCKISCEIVQGTGTKYLSRYVDTPTVWNNLPIY